MHGGNFIAAIVEDTILSILRGEPECIVNKL